jgi:hypothetical protein
MSGDHKEIRPRNPLRVNINETDDILYWTKKLKCSRNELIVAVEAVGESAKKVKEYLAQKK